jgi:cellulose synthase/poly-beta-1,6-N-acetylglucosamine synthase-like glycosyltransferase
MLMEHLFNNYLQSDNIPILAVKFYFVLLGTAAAGYCLYTFFYMLFTAVRTRKVRALGLIGILCAVCAFSESRKILIAACLGLYVAYTFLPSFIYSLYSQMIRARYIRLLLTITLIAVCFVFFPSATVVRVYLAILILIMLASVAYEFFRPQSRSAGVKFKGNETDYCPTVAVIFPVRNESAVIAASLEKVFEMDYPTEKLEVYVIDDHSDDGTFEIVRRFCRNRRLCVFRHDGESGKAAALNAFLPRISSELILILDADHFVPKDFLRHLIHHFQDPRVAFVQAMHTIRNGNASLTARCVEVEYFVLHYLFYGFCSLITYLGSGAVFKRSALLETGQFNNDICTEDLEMSYRIHQKGFKIIYSNDTTTYELAPVRMAQFFKQRYRWLRGSYQAFLLQIRGMFSNDSIEFPKKLEFVQRGLTVLNFLCFFALHLYYALAFFHVTPLLYDYQWLLFFHFTIVITHAKAVLRAHKRNLFPLVFLMPLFQVMYAFPAVRAVVDELVLRKNFKGIKAERG